MSDVVIEKEIIIKFIDNKFSYRESRYFHKIR